MITRQKAEMGVALATALFGAAIMQGAREYGIGWSKAGPEPGMFPFAIGSIVVLASLGNLIKARAEGATAAFITREQARLVVAFALPVLGFVVASLLLGIYVASALYLFGTLVLQNGYAKGRAALVALAMPMGTYLLIERAFQVNLLKGPLEAWLGL
jgi:hypothetical protein